jgi:hypothetical protein
MPQPNNNGHEKKKLVVIEPASPSSLPKSTWDYYNCTVDTDMLQTNGVLQVLKGTHIDLVRNTAMHSHAKLADELQIDFDPFNARITLTKLPPQDD